MKDMIIKIKPFFSPRLWGGDKLKEFGFNIGNEKIGEAWCISAHENGMGFVEINNQTISLEEFYKNKDFFKDDLDIFPLLTKIITANDYLSVQVHPNDEYALKHHNSLGKPECWYILDCPANAKIIYGHNAKTKEELTSLIENQQWDKLLVEVNIKKGDFLYVEPGKIHAITPGVSVYEVQRSSDITYRLYDYNRVDFDGKLRELHIKESIENIIVPDSNGYFLEQQNNLLIKNEFFSVFKLKATNSIWTKPNNVKWFCFTVLKGSGTINNIDFKKGESAICSADLEKLEIKDNIDLLISWI